MPGPYPQEFRDGISRLARAQEDGTTLAWIAKDFGTTRLPCTSGYVKVTSTTATAPGHPGRLCRAVRVAHAYPPAETRKQGPAPRGAPTSPRQACRHKALPARERTRR